MKSQANLESMLLLFGIVLLLALVFLLFACASAF